MFPSMRPGSPWQATACSFSTILPVVSTLITLVVSGDNVNFSVDPGGVNSLECERLLHHSADTWTVCKIWGTVAVLRCPHAPQE